MGGSKTFRHHYYQPASKTMIIRCGGSQRQIYFFLHSPSESAPGVQTWCILCSECQNIWLIVKRNPEFRVRHQLRRYGHAKGKLSCRSLIWDGGRICQDAEGDEKPLVHGLKLFRICRCGKSRLGLGLFVCCITST